MDKCHKCKNPIRGDSGIRCDGVCGKVWHWAKKCSELDEYSANVLKENNFVRFMCNQCHTYMHNIDEVLRNMNLTIEKNSQKIQECNDDFQESQKMQVKELKLLLQSIEKKFGERIDAMQRVQKTCEASILEVNQIKSIADGVKKQSHDLCEAIVRNENENKKICEEIKKSVTADALAGQRAKATYADLFKGNTAKDNRPPKVNKEKPLVLQPKEKQEVGKTKEDLNKNVDPSGLKINSVQGRKSGAVVIQTENEAEREKIKKAIENKMSDRYEIKIPNVAKPRFMVYRMSFKHEDEQLRDMIKKQNECFKNGNFKILKCFETKRGNAKHYNALVETDVDAFASVLASEKINIGWEKCRVKDGMDVTFCFKCKGFNHIAAKCKANEVCFKCLDNHKTVECSKETLNKCINCIRANKKFNLGLDENHMTFNRQCPVYQKKLEHKRNTVNY
ncbi:uncharacterized protein LOC118744201 [Rhagoletis pomonella]|uniref:uncharacterized protein LOC118744201 n=1 Tax=Rhagoletis pomonella TaxID=28610 RepID=UPI00177D144D|nr:uncharacterized protein LOC118744201 [Rhagoletis pomonella]